MKYLFDDPRLLELAFTHRSASTDNNERLEFLGDSLLNFVIATRLYERRATASEGDLSRLRAALVKGPTLADIGHELNMEPHVILGAGELRSGGARRTSILANTLEAVIGAVLLDGGFSAAEACVSRLFGERLKALPEADTLKDSKTRLQEWLQGRGLQLPAYTVDSVSGQPHQQSFVVVCQVPERQVEARGHGRSRRRAEQAAAEQMLSILISDDE